MEHKAWSRADNFRQHLLRIHGKKYDADDDLSMYDCHEPPLCDLDGLSIPSTRWQASNPIQQKFPRAGNESSGSEMRGSTEAMPLESPKQIVDRTPKHRTKGHLKDYCAGSKSDASTQNVLFSTSRKQMHGCTVCQKKFSRKCMLKKHLKRHAKPWSCTFFNCQINFGSKNDWKRHERRQHCQVEKDCNRDNKFWCGFCIEVIEISDINDLEKAWTKRCDHIDDHFCGRGQSVKHISEWEHRVPSGIKASSRHREIASDSLLESGNSRHKSRHGFKGNTKPEQNKNGHCKPEDIKSYGGVEYTRRENGHLSGMLVSQGNSITINGDDFVEYRVLAKIDFA
ncbi:hypothetical protein CEP54_001533 [Fusarium duplospermum]|uniref:C2H2-type domain-containing protein n=1 Tax=Fusarium duplospermum TaxID=1325734 RepID=A0A428R0S0_9HYPO|nr:hypothetical protein CEP54_001533 [Fusarium duplospermum]